MTRSMRSLLVIGAASALALPSPAGAQAEPAAERQGVHVAHEVFAGSELEGYLRALQLVGDVPMHPWSVRGLSPKQVRRLAPGGSAHPWQGRYRFAGDGAPYLRLVRPRTSTIYNSHFPSGANDGPVWAGRGLTNAVQLGFAAEYGPLSVIVAPIAFRAENADFELADNGRQGDAAYRTFISGGIDLPQRFGDAPYARLDPGESEIRVDGLGLSAGVSTRGQVWGPGAEQPLILGVNAGGFPHVFAGTEQPLDLWLAKLHGRVIWARLEQSAWSPVPESRGSRFATAMVVAAQPRGVPGLELGIARFYHTPWGEGGPGRAEIAYLFESFFKENLAGPDERTENQIASVFARWAHPSAGVEVYGELMREDHSTNVRRLVLDPEDLHAYLIGFARSWKPRPERLLSLRLEVANAESSHRERDNRRPGAIPIYTHGRVPQGHTHRGQLLATTAAPAGAVALARLDSYHPGGGWRAEWSRVLRHDRTIRPDGVTDPAGDVSVVHSLGGHWLVFMDRVDASVGVTGLYEMNRHLESDAASVRLDLSLRIQP